MYKTHDVFHQLLIKTFTKFNVNIVKPNFISCVHRERKYTRFKLLSSKFKSTNFQIMISNCVVAGERNSLTDTLLTANSGMYDHLCVYLPNT